MDYNELIFENLVEDLSRDEMLQYIDSIMTSGQLKNTLLKLDTNQKDKIVSCEIETAMSRILVNVNKMLSSANEDLNNKKHKLYLRKLELQINLLRVTHSIAKHANDQKLLLETNNQINEVFTIYRMEGGANMFYLNKDNHE